MKFLSWNKYLSGVVQLVSTLDFDSSNAGSNPTTAEVLTPSNVHEGSS